MLDDFAVDLLDVLEDFLGDELHHQRETVGGNAGAVTSDHETLLITLENGRTFRLTLTEES